MKPIKDTNSNNEPQWYKMLPDHLKPPIDKIKKLENLRKIISLDTSDYISHLIIFKGIGQSRWEVIKTQEDILNKLRQRFPQYSEKELFKEVLLSRFRVKIAFPTSGDPSPEELKRRIENIDQVMISINTFQDLINYILEMDKDILKSFEYFTIQEEINQILSEGSSS